MNAPNAKWFSCSKCKATYQGVAASGGLVVPTSCPQCHAPPDDMVEVNNPNIVSTDNPPDGMETDDVLMVLIYELLCTEVPAGKMATLVNKIRMARFNGNGKVRLEGYFFCQHVLWLCKRLRG